MRTLNLYLLLIFALFLYSCAQVVPPTGGKKDILPPKVLSALPPQETTHFQAKEISIEFDEYIQFRNLDEQLLISPPMEEDPQVEIRGRQLLISIEDSLKENTTYVMNFGNSIVDLNEGNPFGNFTYVFSTGDEVDSLELNGQVLNAYSLKADKDMLVMLYSDFYDSIPFKELPDYVSRTDEEGRFHFSNLKKGEYQILALEDKNKNYHYDPVTESIAFFSKSVKLDEKFSDSLTLFLFAEENPINYIVENKVEEASLKLILNKSSDSVYLEALTGAKIPSHFVEKNATGDSIVFWFSKPSKTMEFEAVVKNKVQTIDTISIKLSPLENDSTTSLNKSVPSKQNFFKPLELVFKSPISKVLKANIKLFKNDSTAVKFKVRHEKNSRKLFINAKWEENQSYKLLLLPRAVSDIYNRSTDTITANFSSNAADLFSSLRVEVESNNKSPKIMQLLNESGKVIRERNVKTGFVHFEHLPAGTYRLKLIFDENKNKKWDTGNYLAKQFPEEAVLFDGKIDVRPKWEQELIWKIK